MRKLIVESTRLTQQECFTTQRARKDCRLTAHTQETSRESKETFIDREEDLSSNTLRSRNGKSRIQ